MRRSVALARAGALATADRRTLLGLVGPPGAGKSWMAAELIGSIPNATYVPMDGFHRANSELDALGLRHIKGAPGTFDVRTFVACLRACRTGDVDVLVPDFDRTIEEPMPNAIVIPATSSLVIVEGNYLLHAVDGWQEVAPLLDELWYLEVDPSIRVERLIARHIEFGKSPVEAREWTLRSDEANARVVEATLPLADFVIAAEDAIVTGPCRP